MGTLERKEEGWDQKAQGTGGPATSGRASWALSVLCRRVCRGRFGQVHRCTEKSTGLSLAAKVIKVKSTKDRVRPPKPLAELRTLHVFLGPPGPHTAPAPPGWTGDPATFPASLSDSHTLVSRSLTPWAMGPSWASGFPPAVEEPGLGGGLRPGVSRERV